MAWCIEAAKSNLNVSCAPMVNESWNKISESEFFDWQSCTLLPVITRTNSEVLYSPRCVTFSQSSPSSSRSKQPSESQYRIIFRGTKTLIIAKGMSHHSIEKLWKIVCTEIEPMISGIETEHQRTQATTPTIQKSEVETPTTIRKFAIISKILGKKKETSPSSERKKESKVSSQTQDFLMIKISAMIKDSKRFKRNIVKLNKKSFFRTKFSNFSKQKTEIGL